MSEALAARLVLIAGRTASESDSEALIAAARALSAPEADAGAVATITMSDVRLAAGEGKLAAHDVLAACNAVIRQRARITSPSGAEAGMLSNKEALAMLSASEVACYRWPMDTAEHRAMRAAFMDGAALTPNDGGGEG